MIIIIITQNNKGKIKKDKNLDMIKITIFMFI